ncbi:ATP-dependent DNA helicase RecG [Soehngenia longivitae]|uniref:ATP-dependent DNA helicase RecG n=1 Tax=Soehngenia longivitae TaxID=2562294 RepID=A0A4Z0D541_9FIRM|nr:ATP-dependent DNA helicase RecG [Soehngenia longivitae]TFZ39582.1 ATP-dependent DNA helicase RecG [Soehngenia longivitae]
MNNLKKNVRYVTNVGPKRAEKLNKLNIYSVEDLIFFFPRTYEDRTIIKSIDEFDNNETVNCIVTIKSNPTISHLRNNLKLLKVIATNGDNEVSLVWFNQTYLKNKINVGEKYFCRGKITKNKYEIQIQNPEIEPFANNNSFISIVPIYSLTDGLSNKELIKIIKNCLDEYLMYVVDILPDDLRNNYNLMNKQAAIKALHFPNNMAELEKARKTLAYEELLVLQLTLSSIKIKDKEENGISFSRNDKLNIFINNLPFELTKSQKDVVDEILNDMSQGKQMNRLVQGDVGSGKTVISAIAMFNAVLNGYQATMMAPTEILALQHYETLSFLFNKIEIKIEVLTSSTNKKRKENILKGLALGEIDILIGTHSIIQENVLFKNLGLVVTDEQHRFGVNQRMKLAAKGNSPDILVMTATPIPRSLGLILYGDLDISTIKELPPGRQKIETFVMSTNKENEVFSFINKQIEEGHQAYIVCPLIESNNMDNLNSAESVYSKIVDTFGDKYICGLIHGKLNQKEKEKVMDDFKNGIIKILVSTTVIEVGVNVANANTMVIYNADRFGLSQLHQLRGRVGRSSHKSYCILLNDNFSKISRERMRVLQSTNDGFEISEKDLYLRGPGDFFGTKQHGLPQLKIANLFRDINILKVAQNDAKLILEENRLLNNANYGLLRNKVDKLIDSIDNEIILN